jgi:hypothetical protein
MRIAICARVAASGAMVLALSAACDSNSPVPPAMQPDVSSSPTMPTGPFHLVHDLVPLPRYGEGFKSGGDYVQVSGMHDLDRRGPAPSGA